MAVEIGEEDGHRHCVELCRRTHCRSSTRFEEFFRRERTMIEWEKSFVQSWCQKTGCLVSYILC